MLTESEQRAKIAAMRRAKLEALATGTCLHPEAPKDCSGYPIGAHTIQAALLRQIAEDQHVCAIEADEFNVRRTMSRIGVNEASTFPGFCSSHDSSLFLPIEGNNYLKINRHHALLLAYRALSKEIYLKRAFRDADLLKYVPSHLVTQEERQVQLILPGEISRLLSIAEPTFDRIGDALLRGQHADTYYCVVTLDRIPNVLCSGAMILSFDFHGNLLRTAPGNLDILTLSVLPYGVNSGVAYFAWHGRSTASENLVRSLRSLHKSKIPDAIVKLMFRRMGNFFVRPSWWEALNNQQKDTLFNRPEGYLDRFEIAPGSIKYVDWKAVGIYCNFRI